MDWYWLCHIYIHTGDIFQTASWQRVTSKTYLKNYQNYQNYLKIRFCMEFV